MENCKSFRSFGFIYILIRLKKKKKEVKRRSKASLFGVAGEEMAGLVGDDCQRYSMVEIGAGESDLRVREAAWWE